MRSPEAIELARAERQSELAEARALIDEALTRLDVLPGFRAGMRNVSLDEQHACIYAAALDGELVRIDGVAAWDGAGAPTRMIIEDVGGKLY